MTTNNLPATWADVEHWQIADLAALPVDVLATLDDEIKQMEARAKACKAMLGAVVQAKYEFTGRNETGTHRVNDGAIDVVINVPKRVEWDQSKLADLYFGDAGPEMVDLKYSVSETKYNAWPADWQAAFTPARTVKPGSPSIKFERCE